MTTARLGSVIVGFVCTFGCAAPLSKDTAPSQDATSVSAALHPTITEHLERVGAMRRDLPEERKAVLDRVATYVAEQRSEGKTAKLVFICTHNSRRSQLSQLWASAAAAHYGVEGVEAFSGGTEATAFNPRAVATLERAGFEIDSPADGSSNPEYAVSFSGSQPPIRAFSKRYADPPNPASDFAAIMTCSDADASCPFVHGAELRVALPYVDPKVSDGQPSEAATYDERRDQIAAEMFYLLAEVRARADGLA